MNSKSNVLITGVSGFIGSNLLDFLLDETDWTIHGIDDLSTGRKANIEHNLENERFKFIHQKVSDLKSIREFDVIFHLAALPRIQPSFELVSEHVQANLLESVHLIELMIEAEYFPRLVYSGSSSIYGNPELIPTPESEKIDCMNPYAFQKYEVEKYLEMLAVRYPLNYVTLRYFNPYGPRSFNPDNPFNAYSSVVGIFLHRNKNGLPLLVTGDGSQQRDFIHVQDVAYANFKAAIADGRPNKAYNVGQGSTMSILDLAKAITSDIEFIPPRDGEADITHADTSAIKKDLGWEPQCSLLDYLKGEL